MMVRLLLFGGDLYNLNPGAVPILYQLNINVSKGIDKSRHINILSPDAYFFNQSGTNTHEYLQTVVYNVGACCNHTLPFG